MPRAWSKSTRQHRRCLSWARLLFLALLFSARPSSTFASDALSPPPLSPRELPAGLAAWLPWALWEAPSRDCARSATLPLDPEQLLCSWPGQLELEVLPSYGRFVLHAQADATVRVVLPGSSALWPQEVLVEKKPVPVLPWASAPSVVLESGRHKIEGRFVWSQPPDTLPLGRHTALVSLTLLGERVTLPRRDEDGRLWLAGGAVAGSGAAESLTIEVSRKLEDQVPPRITTRLLLRASGRAREVPLGKVTLPGTLPLSLSSELPARLASDGSLVAQVRAGNFRIEIVARAEGPLDRIERPSAQAPWPTSEIWVWAPDPQLREVAVSGGREIDPSRTSLEEDWKSLPAFELVAGDALVLSTLRRGDPLPPPNQVHLSRDLWLDLDGAGFTIRDHLTGTVQREHRLELLSATPGLIRVDGTPELITALSPGGPGGVELRRSALNLEAQFSLPRSSGLSANGWSVDAQSLSATLHLPPGWLFLGARGVDSAPGSWLSSWDLFELFYVLLVTLAALKLGGKKLSALALGTLLLAHGEDDAPFWLWAALLAVAALRTKAMPRLVRWLLLLAAWSTSLAWVLIVVPFAAAHLRAFVHPLLTHQGQDADATSWSERREISDSSRPRQSLGGSQMEPLAPPASMANEVPAEMDGEPSPSSKSYDFKARNLAQDPKAVVQTGQGLPNWSHESWPLMWSGPVAREHQFSLWLLPPWLVRWVELARVLGAVLLGLLLGRRMWQKPPQSGKSEPRASAPATVAVAASLAFCGLFAPTSALAAEGTVEPAEPSAGPPSRPEATELLRRTLPQPSCQECLSVSSARVTLRGSDLELELFVHAGVTTRLRLPGPAATWQPLVVSLGQETRPPLRLEDGVILARIPAGAHRLLLRGPVNSDELTLEFADAPRHLEVAAPGWDVSGLSPEGALEGALTLARRESSSARTGSEQASSLPPWLTLTRELELGSSWLVRSTLRRQSTADVPLTVRVPLIASERVTTSDATVDGTHAVLTLARGQSEVSWSSSLEPQPRLDLVAASSAPFSEVWQLDCGVAWHCLAEGLSPVSHQAKDRWRPTYKPFPGERVSFTITRPSAVSGSSKTIEGVTLTITPGERLTRSELTFLVQASAGGVQRVRLPEASELQTLTVGGEARAARLEDGAIAVSLSPGLSEVRLSWQEPRGTRAFWRASPVLLEGGAANVSVVVRPGAERWLLALRGPSWGPTVLFWGYLAVVLLAALVLGRLPGSPLGTWQWLGLSLGLTQIPAAMAALIPGWFFAVAWYQRAEVAPQRFRTFVIVLLVLATFAMLFALGVAVYSGLVVVPDMQVRGAGSSADRLVWYVDRVSGELPQPLVVGTSIWVFRLLMLLWSLWLAAYLLRWLRWAWAALLTALPGPTKAFRTAEVEGSPEQADAAAAAEPSPASDPQK